MADPHPADRASTATNAASERLPVALRRHPIVPVLARELDRCLRGRCPAGARAPAVVGVSGGADSVALLLAAAVLAGRRRRPWPPPLAVHVHHHLRGAAADADAAFVAKLAARLGLEHRRADVHPADESGGIAAAARRLRLRALASIAADTGRPVVLTAHHAADQCETVLLRLARGVEPARAGMAAVRPLKPPGILLVRPLLSVVPERLRDACRAAEVRWREDASNADVRHPRSRVRHEVLPVLEAIAPGAWGRIAAAAYRAADRPIDATHHGSAAALRPTTASFCRAELASAAPQTVAGTLRRAALELAPAAADRLGGKMLRQLADAVRDADPRPRRWDWPAGLTVHLDVRRLRIERTTDHLAHVSEEPLRGQGGAPAGACDGNGEDSAPAGPLGAREGDRAGGTGGAGPATPP